MRLLALLPLCLYASANVEKTIFLAPPSTTIPPADAGLDDLGLERLSPLSPVVRTQLNTSFPTDEAPRGTESWYFLENMNPGQRYEARICYLATQPTAFVLETYTLPRAMEDPSLVSSISRYSANRLNTLQPQPASIPPRKATLQKTDTASLDSAPTTDSVLFLRIHAAADYFTLDRDLMENVPPVAADIILDPFLGNVFPRSLVPTAGWVLFVAVVGVVVARVFLGEFKRVAEVEEDKKEK